MHTWNCSFFFLIICITVTLYVNPATSECVSPLISTNNEPFINDCGLYCSEEDTATPLTKRVSNKYISILVLLITIPAAICNIIFTINNAFEHKENDETFATTPITYDSLFIIDGAYLVVIICLIIPHFSFFDGGSTISETFICNSSENTLSISNPIYGSNGLCFLIGILIFNGFKVILIYTGILCVNIWFRLWKPMVDAGIKKLYIHTSVWVLIFIFDIFIIGFSGIDANPSNGLCYLSFTHNIALLVLFDILPNILFIIISISCITYSAKMLSQELNVIQQADLISDDLLNLIHRMLGFLIMSIIGFVFMVLTEIIWVSMANEYELTTKEWVARITPIVNQNDGIYKYEFGDRIIEELKNDSEGYNFPNEIMYIMFPVAALFSNLAIIVLTCHRRQSDRWKRVTISLKSTITTRISQSKERRNRRRLHIHPAPLTPIISDKNDSNQVPLAGPGGAIEQVLSDSDEHNDDVPKTEKKVSIKIAHTSQASANVERIGIVTFNTPITPDTPDDDNDTPTGQPSLADEDTFIRHPTPHDQSGNPILTPSDLDEYQKQLSLQEFEQKKNKMTLEEQTEYLIKMDSSKKTKLEHLRGVSAASVDYAKLESLRKNNSSNMIDVSPSLKEETSDDIKINQSDIDKSTALNTRLQSLQLSNSPKSGSSSSLSKRNSGRSKTLPVLPKRSSTQRHFLSFLEKAIDDDIKKDDLQKNASVKSVTFDKNVNKPDVSQKAADVIIRSVTDSVTIKEDKKLKKKKKLKKVQTDIDGKNITITIDKTDNDDDDEDTPEPEPEPEPQPAASRRTSQHQRQKEETLRKATARQKKSFFDKWGKRRMPTLFNFGKKKNKDKGKCKQKDIITMKTATELLKSSGRSIYKPSTLLQPINSQFNLDPDYFEDYRTDTGSSINTASSFQDIGDHDDAFNDIVGSISTNSAKTLSQHNKDEFDHAWQWKSNGNVHLYTLADNDFKNMLHNTFTPHSTRNVRRMTFDEKKMYDDNDYDNDNKDDKDKKDKKDKNTPLVSSQSTGNIKNDPSVTGIGSDGRIVFSDMSRFRSSPGLTLSENKEHDYPPPKAPKHRKKPTAPKRNHTHHRNDTLHGKLLDDLPHADRKGLFVTVLPDFSVKVATQGKHHAAATAKLNFTLKPVASMKILL